MLSKLMLECGQHITVLQGQHRGITGGGGGGEDFQITKQKWLLVVPVAAADTKSVTVTAAIDIVWVLIGNLSCDRGLIPAAFLALSCV
jgi:hypothetical protein